MISIIMLFNDIEGLNLSIINLKALYLSEIKCILSFILVNMQWYVKKDDEDDKTFVSILSLLAFFW